MKYESYFKNYLALIEKTLDDVLPKAKQYPPVIHEAMRYCVFPGGKRFRPVLALAACEAVGAKPEAALIAGAALELIHCYSLVHDDLPALDNDDLRRGKATCHRQYGEAMGVLTGDGLLNTAFQILPQAGSPEKVVRLLDEISTAAGTYGMIGGQVADIALFRGDEGQINLPKLDYISSHKTGKLIKASVVSGAIAGGASREALKKITKYGECIGLAFQMVDDLLDGDGYMKIIKPSELRQKIRDLIAHAKREIKFFGKRAEKLQVLADFLLDRVPRQKHAAVDR